MEEKKTTDTETTNSTPDTTGERATETSSAPSDSATTTTTHSPAAEAAPVTAEPAAETAPVAAEPAAAPAASTNSMKQYGIALAIVAVFGVGLVFALEQQGRIDTNYFGWLQSSTQGQPVATVNGVEISGAEFAQNREQVIISAQQQGVDVEDPQVLEEIEAQALEVLINTQLLRQAATDAGIVISEDEIEARYQEIVESVGGEETLTSRMGELGITPDSLRNDIEGELLVQALIEAEVDTSSIEVSEEEVVAFYEQAGGQGAELPPLEEVRGEIEQQIRGSQEQELVGEYIESLRSAAEIEILI